MITPPSEYQGPNTPPVYSRSQTALSVPRTETVWVCGVPPVLCTEMPPTCGAEVSTPSRLVGAGKAPPLVYRLFVSALLYSRRQKQCRR